MSYREPDPTPEQRARREAERKHFLFAGVLVIGSVLLLPTAGGLFLLMVKLGWVASPF